MPTQVIDLEVRVTPVVRATSPWRDLPDEEARDTELVRAGIRAERRRWWEGNDRSSGMKCFFGFLAAAALVTLLLWLFSNYRSSDTLASGPCTMVTSSSYIGLDHLGRGQYRVISDCR